MTVWQSWWERFTEAGSDNPRTMLDLDVPVCRDRGRIISVNLSLMKRDGISGGEGCLRMKEQDAGIRTSEIRIYTGKGK